MRPAGSSTTFATVYDSCAPMYLLELFLCLRCIVPHIREHFASRWRAEPYMCCFVAQKTHFLSALLSLLPCYFARLLQITRWSVHCTYSLLYSLLCCSACYHHQLPCSSLLCSDNSCVVILALVGAWWHMFGPGGCPLGTHLRGGLPYFGYALSPLDLLICP